MDTTTRTPWPERGITVVTDAGLETWLLFERGVELPAFAAYPLAATSTGRAVLTEYLQHYAAIASSIEAASVLDAATWRANPDWADVLGHDLGTLGFLIDACIQVVADVRATWRGNQPFLINGPVGPRGDGYHVEDSMTPEASADYHGFQVSRMADAGVDVITALTMGYVGEASGIALAARAAGVPAVVSFTLETDGRLPTGMPLGEAIEATDSATGAYPLHYMINCAHPTHFDHVLDPDASWAHRIGGIRANASALSHAELDEMVELDEGDPDDLARRYVALRDQLPSLHVIGGCCGMDHRHVAAIATAWQR
ncbi:MAG: homocysteine S-methyltransferase family protein [Acidimicrobiia bacterium]|nr:homocysteine S-methyltransferase family protein [Acidimicrobiia bacterium]